MTEVTLAILIARVYAGCCWASSGGCLPRRGILVHRGKMIAANIRAPKVSAQAILWMALVAGSAQRVRAPGSESSWTPVTPDWIPMTIKKATPVITETGHSQFGAGVACCVVCVNGTPRVLLDEQRFADKAIRFTARRDGKYCRPHRDGPQVQVISFC